MNSLRIGTFTPSILITAATESGRLERAGLTLEEVPVQSSPGQFTSLRAGELDVVMTSPDNVLAYRFLPDNPLNELLEVEVLAAIDRGLGLSLWLAPGITDVSEVRGRDVAVDVPVSGFAFVAFALLERAGLSREDYTLVSLGSTPKRAEALSENRCAATVLNAGNELRAGAHGAHFVSAVTDLGPYLGTVLAALPTTDPEVSRLRAALTDVLVETAAEIVAGQHTDVLRAAVQSRLGLGPSEAEAHLARLVDPSTGYVADGAVNPAAIDTLIGLRRRHRLSAELAHMEAEWPAMLSGRAGP